MVLIISITWKVRFCSVVAGPIYVPIFGRKSCLYIVFLYKYRGIVTKLLHLQLPHPSQKNSIICEARRGSKWSGAASYVNFFVLYISKTVYMRIAMFVTLFKYGNLHFVWMKPLNIPVDFYIVGVIFQMVSVKWSMWILVLLNWKEMVLLSSNIPISNKDGKTYWNILKERLVKSFIDLWTPFAEIHLYYAYLTGIIVFWNSFPKQISISIITEDLFQAVINLYIITHLHLECFF